MSLQSKLCCMNMLKRIQKCMALTLFSICCVVWARQGGYWKLSRSKQTLSIIDTVHAAIHYVDGYLLVTEWFGPQTNTGRGNGGRAAQEELIVVSSLTAGRFRRSQSLSARANFSQQSFTLFLFWSWIFQKTTTTNGSRFVLSMTAMIGC